MHAPRASWITASLAATVLLLAAGAPAAAARPRPAPDLTPPSAPTNLRVTAVTHTTVSVAWDPSTDNVAVTSYVVWYEGMNGVVAVTPPQTSAALTGLKPGTSYQINIRAWDALSAMRSSSTAP
jgi:chitinase